MESPGCRWRRLARERVRAMVLGSETKAMASVGERRASSRRYVTSSLFEKGSMPMR